MLLSQSLPQKYLRQQSAIFIIMKGTGKTEGLALLPHQNPLLA
jgi:hypothetical protein